MPSFLRNLGKLRPQRRLEGPTGPILPRLQCTMYWTGKSESRPAAAGVGTAGYKEISSGYLDTVTVSVAMVNQFQAGIRTTSFFMPEDTMKHVTAGGWAVQPGEFKLGSKIAAGAMGQVMKATLRGSIVCAAKMLKQGEGDEQAYKDLITELEILTSVGSHPNLVGFLGACIADKKEPIVFEEYVDGPSLEKYLVERALNGSRLEQRTILGWSLHLLYALEFLHASDPIIMHRGEFLFVST